MIMFVVSFLVPFYLVLIQTFLQFVILRVNGVFEDISVHSSLIHVF